VVPHNAVAAKMAAIRAYGATLHHCEPTIAAREAACAAVQAQTGAELVHPYTDARVIAGQGTAALELLGHDGRFDALVTPLGGGGLLSGTAITAAAVSPATRVFGAEPAGAADGFASLQRGERVLELAPDTVCDGLRGLLGAPNFALLRAHRVEVLLADDAATVQALRLFWQRAKQLIEPSSAIALAVVLANRERFAGQRVGIVLSGGNVDLDALAGLFASA
jgi:threonine dehydratase